MRRFVSYAVLVVSFLLVACSSGPPNVSGPPNEFGQPSITIEATSLDLGNVINGDVVIRELAVRNDGEADLVIDRVSTSCGCTKATVNPMTIPAGTGGTLQVEFDSGAHGPDLTGALIRQVFISSNDPQQPEVQVELSVNVEAKTPASG